MEVADGVHRFGTRMVNWYLIERGGRLTLPLKGPSWSSTRARATGSGTS
jgi:hypothetical protein